MLFVPFQLKNGLCYDNLGLLIGSNGTNKFQNIAQYFIFRLDMQSVLLIFNFRP